MHNVGMSSQKLKPKFNHQKKRHPQKLFQQADTTYFDSMLRWRWKDDKTADTVGNILTALHIPFPQREAELLLASEGFLLFDQKHGVVIRIESKKTTCWQRVSHPHMLEPLGSFDAGKVIVEICPGTHVAREGKPVDTVRHKMLKAGLYFRDPQRANVGMIPLQTPRFPDGVPVIIDRLSVSRFWLVTKPVRDVLGLTRKLSNLFHGATDDFQAAFYGPLRRALQNAGPDICAGKSTAIQVERFWQLCAKYKREGKLVAGWLTAQDPEILGSYKSMDAKAASQRYACRFKRA